MNIDKSFTKRDLCDFITLYEMDIEDYLEMNKSTLQIEILSYLKYNKITFVSDYPTIHNNEDLTEYLSQPKPNNELNYKQKQEVIQKAKKLISYARGGYSIALTEYVSVDEIYEHGLCVANYCDIPTCRRAITELNLDNKIRNKIEMKISSRVQKQLQNKNKNKQDLMPSLTIKKGDFLVIFD